MPKTNDQANDHLWVGPEIAEGVHPFIRAKEDGVQAGLMGDLPMASTCVDLEHVNGCCYEVTKEYRPTANGPAQVATRRYREGYDRIFGKAPAVGQA